MSLSMKWRTCLINVSTGLYWNMSTNFDVTHFTLSVDGLQQYYLIYLTLHWPIFMNNPLIFVSFTLLYSRGVPFVIYKYCSYQLSYIPVKYRSGIGVWLRCVWFGFNPPLGNIIFKVEINEKCAKHAVFFCFDFINKIDFFHCIH